MSVRGLAVLVCAALFATAALAAEPARSLKPLAASRAPVLGVRDPQGDVKQLTDYRGRVLLVNFWATWCEPCLSEMPALEDLQRKLQGRPFTVLAVNFAESEERVQAFLNNYEIHLPVLYDKDMGAARRWNARILPASFVVDAQGRIRYSVVGEADWTAPGIVAEIEKLLPR